MIYSSHCIQQYISKIIKTKILLSRQKPSITHCHTPNPHTHTQTQLFIIHYQANIQTSSMFFPISYWITPKFSERSSLQAFFSNFFFFFHFSQTLKSFVFSALVKLCLPFQYEAIPSPWNLELSRAQLLWFLICSRQYVYLFIKPWITLLNSWFSLASLSLYSTLFNDRACFIHLYDHCRRHFPPAHRS